MEYFAPFFIITSEDNLVCFVVMLPSKSYAIKLRRYSLLINPNGGFCVSPKSHGTISHSPAVGAKSHVPHSIKDRRRYPLFIYPHGILRYISSSSIGHFLAVGAEERITYIFIKFWRYPPIVDPDGGFVRGYNRVSYSFAVRAEYILTSYAIKFWRYLPFVDPDGPLTGAFNSVSQPFPTKAKEFRISISK